MNSPFVFFCTRALKLVRAQYVKIKYIYSIEKKTTTNQITY